MDNTHTHDVTTAANTVVAPATTPVEVVAPVETVAEVAAVAETPVTVEMVAVSEKKAVEDQLVAKTAEFTALSSANVALQTELETLKAKSSADLTAAKEASDAIVAELNNQVKAESSKVAEYKAALEVVIPQEKLSEAVLKAASGIVEGYDATKKVADQTPTTIVKLLKFSNTIAQSTNAGAVETSAKKPKNPNVNLVFDGITIKQKKSQE